MILDQYRTNNENYYFWKNFFIKKGLKVIEMSAQEHDRLA
ncbi:MAG: hypothetical protein UU34_C0019G0001, partial [Candidatus Curtissbacteria bacterium GW2011_GWA1_41_11]